MDSTVFFCRLYHDIVSLLPDVLIYSGCSGKIWQTRWLIKNIHLSLTVLKTGKHKIKAVAWSYERPLLVLARTFSLCAHMLEEVKDLSRACSVRPLLPFLRVLLSWPQHLPKASCFLSLLSLWVSISTYELWGHKYSDHNNHLGELKRACIITF